ncbi:kinase-like domain-containing protein [Gautieria morchelliformis]|nr:kinase-like domain-containing protein [Gautieria morchelliformis]
MLFTQPFPSSSATDTSNRLQIPDNPLSPPGPSSPASCRSPSTAGMNTFSSPSSTNRASPFPHTSQRMQHEATTEHRDAYSHPATVAFVTAHPRRTIRKFGPYILLQTLGRGAFATVKLELHCQRGEEVAVKLIRSSNADSPLRMTQNIQHPNIVRLYEVIEIDHCIGIVLQYASGGDLFNHILAPEHHLKDQDACKLFAQLISGVSYMHAKNIVHWDLKLENLLLDTNHNLLITDFGFADHFDQHPDHLMKTSCGSPCYAAPELILSQGELYVGPAVDIWSCGVILYVMLTGSLPFDYDFPNAEGKNIVLLYQEILHTPLTFPDHVTDDARDLLSMMLVPDPTQRSRLPEIMSHRWLMPSENRPGSREVAPGGNCNM